MEILKEFGLFLLWWSTSTFMTIGMFTTFLTFYKGGVIQLDIDKLSETKEVKED